MRPAGFRSTSTRKVPVQRTRKRFWSMWKSIRVSSPSDRAWATVLAAACGCMLAGPADAHGFGQRYDLPLPLSLYLFGTAAAVVLSFIIVGLFVRHAPGTRGYPRLDLNAYVLGRWIAHPAVALILQLIAVALLIF